MEKGIRTSEIELKDHGHKRVDLYCNDFTIRLVDTRVWSEDLESARARQEVYRKEEVCCNKKQRAMF